MIDAIIEVFRKQAKEHKTIKSFVYSHNYEKGNGRDIYPLFWLEEAIRGQNQNNVFTNSIDFSILFVPNEKQSKQDLQNLAFSIGLNIIERIKQNETEVINILPNWSYLTLSDYYDDDAVGCRFSVSFTQRNLQNLCLIDEQFDENKEFDKKNGLVEFDVLPANGCETFSNKLPVFDLKTRK